MDILESILEGREKRYDLLLKLLERFKRPLLVLTLNYPGVNKINDISRFIFSEALKSIDIFSFILTIQEEGPAGFCLIGLLSEDPLQAKLKAVKIEEEHPLGRLFDIDIIDYPFRILSRRDLGFKVRACILCGREASECIIERRHSLSELLTKIENMVRVYNERNCHLRDK
ncbi:MAG: citrate lyase holo-[acyl-carrier protein] synthase [Synergistetes bacterium]|nr:citrate lyase holo-[acyl-carrier protein] synthase [Synergistota bacterium]MDW8191590.1 citrate lyase holo-[acyl-carrier protein] synthase [Synergistota bacterium]